MRRWLIHYSELSAKRLTGTRRKGRVLVDIIVAASALGSMLAATRYTNRTLLAQAQAQAQELVVGFGALYVLGGLVLGSGFDRPPG